MKKSLVLALFSVFFVSPAFAQVADPATDVSGLAVDASTGPGPTAFVTSFSLQKADDYNDLWYRVNAGVGAEGVSFDQKSNSISFVSRVDARFLSDYWTNLPFYASVTFDADSAVKYDAMGALGFARYFEKTITGPNAATIKQNGMFFTAIEAGRMQSRTFNDRIHNELLASASANPVAITGFKIGPKLGGFKRIAISDKATGVVDVDASMGYYKWNSEVNGAYARVRAQAGVDFRKVTIYLANSTDFLKAQNLVESANRVRLGVVIPLNQR